MVTNLKIKLAEKGLTQAEVARQSGINAGVLCNIVNGKLVPNTNHKLLLTTMLDAEAEDLFEPHQLVKVID